MSLMASHRKPLYTPRFGSQSSQTDQKFRHNERHCKLSKTRKNVTCEPSPLTLPGGRSPEVTLSHSRKVRTNYLLRYYLSVKGSRKSARKSTDNLRASDDGKSLPVEQNNQRTSPDYFKFPSEDVKPTDEKSRTKQDVLKTIRRMREENKVIRERLFTLSQLSQNN